MYMKRSYFFVLVAVVGAVWYGFAHKKSVDVAVQEEKTALAQVSTIAIEAGNVSGREAVYQASVEGVQNTVLKAGVSGTVTNLSVHVGDRVAVGQVLATIENPGGSATVSDAGLRSAEINQAEASMNRLKGISDEAKRMYSHDKTHINEVAKTTAELNYASARASLQSLLDGHVVKSPVAGVVLSLPIDKNESVSLGQDIVTVGKPDALKAIFFMSAADAKGMTVGKQVSILSGTDTNIVAAVISKVAPEADAATGKIRVEARPESASASLIAGVSAKVSVPMNDTSSVRSMLIPLEALLVGQNESTVFVLHDGDDRARKIAVEVLRMRGGEAEIGTDNFQVNDRVITTGAHTVDEGEKVMIVNN